MHNDTDDAEYIEPGQRIAQMIFEEYIQGKFTEVDELDSTIRGAGGFGHSGQ